MLRKYSTVLILWMFLSFAALSQTANDSTVSLKGKNYFGVNVGGTTGLGLSYIYMPGKDGIQFTFLPLIDSKSTIISLGVTYLHSIKELKQTSFYFYWGNHLTNMFSFDYVLDIGLGPGVHYKMNDFYISFMVGYALYGIGGNMMVRPTAELGTFYNF